MAILGCIPGAVAEIEGTGSQRMPYQTGGGSVALHRASHPHDKGGWSYEGADMGGTWSSNAFRAKGANATAWYYLATRMTFIDTQAVDDWGLFYSHQRSQTGRTQGDVRAGTRIIDSTTYQWYVEEYNGSAWVALTGTWGGGNLSINTVYYITIELVISTKTVQVYVDGTSRLSVTATYMADTNVPGTPSLYHFRTSGDKATDNHIDVYEIFGNDSSGSSNTRFTYDSANSRVHVYGRVPSADDTVTPNSNEWQGQGDALNKYRNVDDVYDDAPVVGNYISGLNARQGFEIPDLTNASATPVGVAFFHLGQAGTFEYKAYCPSEASAYSAFTRYFVTTYIWWGFSQVLQTSPGGNAWTRARFNELRVGVEASGAPGSQVYDGFITGVLTSYGNQQSNAPAPPARTETRRFAWVA